MKWHKATMAQLECILKHDEDCPPQLKGAVELEIARRLEERGMDYPF
ncbi:hypothetical protein [Priestia aryabhattai]